MPRHLSGRERLQGMTTQDIADLTLRQVPEGGSGGGGYVPVPGSPTEFVRVTHHDANASSGNSVVKVPFLDITTLPGATLISFQALVVCAPSPTMDHMFYVGSLVASSVTDDEHIYITTENGGTIAPATNGTVNLDDYDGVKIASYSGRPSSDSNASTPTLYFDNGNLSIWYYGMSTGEAMDVTIEAQLTPIAPTPRPTTTTGLE